MVAPFTPGVIGNLSCVQGLLQHPMCRGTRSYDTALALSPKGCPLLQQVLTLEFDLGSDQMPFTWDLIHSRVTSTRSDLGIYIEAIFKLIFRLFITLPPHFRHFLPTATLQLAL